MFRNSDRSSLQSGNLQNTTYQTFSSSKHLFIIPTDAHNYKITGMLKTIKIWIIAPTCFGSRRNHHQGAFSCLAKTTIMILLCSSLMTSMLWWHTNLLCKCTVHGTPCTAHFHTGWYATTTLTMSLTTSTIGS